MNEEILLKCGEMVLKGLNRVKFENRLIADLRRRLEPCGPCKIVSLQSTVHVTPAGEFDMDRAMAVCERTFGVVTLCRAAVCEKDLGIIYSTAAEYLGGALSEARTFKVEAKRSDKRFPYGSLDIMREVGGMIAERYPHLAVDVHNPEVTVYVEIRDHGAYVHGAPVYGAGGLPAGVNGRALGLISGGIDSPVALWMMARRGIELEAVHFFSYPYTGDEAKEKVIALLRIVAGWAGPVTLHIAPFTTIQEEIRDNCDPDMSTVLGRRMMVRVSQRIAIERGLGALVTGESMGQVASQTMEALAATDDVAALPIFRPLIGLDKRDIIEYARRIGTFETSVLPYEDCCNLFTPRHPVTRPKIERAEREERKINVKELAEACARGVETVRIE